MGGCCCSSRKSHLHGTPVYYYCPPNLNERDSLVIRNGVASSDLAAGFLIHLNLDTSTPDTYQAPPAPLPYDLVFGCPAASTDSESTKDETISCSSFKTTSATCVDLEESDCKANGKAVDVSAKVLGLSKPCDLDGLVKEDEDVCPICLEDYDTDNPKYVIKCEHYYHLSCILEWMERSDACPICDKEMVFDRNSS